MRGIVVFLIAAYIAFAVGAVVSEINNYNTVADFYSKEKINVLEFVKSRFIDILINPIKVAEEVKQKAKKIEKESKRNDITILMSNQIEKSSSSKSKKRSEKSSLNPKPPRELLASYLALLDEVEKKLKRFDLRGELYLSNSSKYMNLSEDELLQKIKEKEEKINELAKQTLRKKIDYKGVEINRFEGEKYFVFIKKEFPEVTVAWRLPSYYIAYTVYPLKYSAHGFINNPEEAREVFVKTHKKYREILRIDRAKDTSKAIIYLFYNGKEFCETNIPTRICEINHSSPFFGGITPKNGMILLGAPSKYALVHESVHALDQIYGNGFCFLKEGFPNYVRYRLWKDEKMLNWTNAPSFCRAYNLSKPYLNFSVEKLLKEYNNPKFRGSQGIYNVVDLFIRFLIEKYGLETFIKLYSNRKHYKDYGTVNFYFKKYYKKSLKEIYYDEFLPWLKNKGKKCEEVL